MWDVRAITDSEVDLFRLRLSRGFGGDPAADDGGGLRFRELVPLDRTFAAFDAGDIVGTGAGFTFDVTVPGGRAVAMGGTTMVSVQPTHRRRGVLRAMMSHHLDDVAQRGEPLAGLWASESSIYGRFGYGTSTYRHDVTLEAETITLRPPEPPGRVRLVDHDHAEPILRSVYERVRQTRPGMLSRSDPWWTHRRMRDEEDDREGRSSRRYAVYEEAGSVDGYATYRQKEEWEGFFSAGEVAVIEVMTATPNAHRGLWRFLTNIDLFKKVEWWNAPLDDPLTLEVTDPRRVQRRLWDAMWIRVMDVPAALEARTYETDGALTLHIDDPFRPTNSGNYRLEVSDGRATCRRRDDEGDVSLDIDVLGHLYLGGGSAVAMAAAGRITGSDGSVTRLHRIFRTDAVPWCPEVF
jgi:predicted acetyltransferase